MAGWSLDDVEAPVQTPCRSLLDLHKEKDDESWYWRALASLASMLIAVGFLIFGGAFLVDNDHKTNVQVVPVTIAALALINTGYILSVILWFVRRNWVYQLECIFLPCLYSSLLGFVNTLLVPKLVLGVTDLTAPTLASLLVSVVSTAAYSVLAFFTWRRLEDLRLLDREPVEKPSLPYVTEEEQQRMQMEALLMRKDPITEATLASQRTYHITMPILPSKSADLQSPSPSTPGPVSDTY